MGPCENDNGGEVIDGKRHREGLIYESIQNKYTRLRVRLHVKVAARKTHPKLAVTRECVSAELGRTLSELMASALVRRAFAPVSPTHGYDWWVFSQSGIAMPKLTLFYIQKPRQALKTQQRGAHSSLMLSILTAEGVSWLYAALRSRGRTRR
jgi:hypothetical protein